MAKPVTTNFDNHTQHISGTLFPACLLVCLLFFFSPTLWLLSLAPQNASLGKTTSENWLVVFIKSWIYAFPVASSVPSWLLPAHEPIVYISLLGTQAHDCLYLSNFTLRYTPSRDAFICATQMCTRKSIATH